MESKYIKPAGVWKHSGYIHSALELISKYEYLVNQNEYDEMNEKKSSMRKKTS